MIYTFRVAVLPTNILCKTLKEFPIYYADISIPNIIFYKGEQEVR